MVLALPSLAAPVFAAAVDVDTSATYDWVGWQFIGGVNAGPVLDIGDVVNIRFMGEGGGPGKVLSFEIKSERQRNHWIAWLPGLVEQANIGARMGSVNAQGRFVDEPKNTSLYYYAVSPGVYRSVITEVHHVGGGVTTLPNLNSADQQGTLLFEAPAQISRDSEFSVRAGAVGNGKTGTLNVQVFDVPARRLVYHQTGTIEGTYAPSYVVKPSAGWVGPLTVVANVNEWGESGRSYQKFHTVTFTAAYDFVFPQGVSGYSAGIKVLQPKDGRVYECRPVPHSGFCRQWSTNDVQFEPGVGDNWQEAWLTK